MKCKNCEENGEEVEMDKFPLIIGDVEQGILVHKCPNCNNEIEESYSDYEPDGSHSSSKGEKGDDKSNLKSKAKASLTSVNENKRDINRKSPRNPESFLKPTQGEIKKYGDLAGTMAQKRKMAHPESLPDWAENYINDTNKWNKEYEKKKVSLKKCPVCGGDYGHMRLNEDLRKPLRAQKRGRNDEI